METLKIYKVDAFASELFSGNPAAVVILDKWIDSEIMQKIGGENNLSETAFVVKNQNHYEIRWFTPTVEMDLCGHATLAAAFVLLSFYDKEADVIYFYSHLSGQLRVTKENGLYHLDFPADKIHETNLPESLMKGVRKIPVETYRGKSDYMLVYRSQKEIELIRPDFDTIAKVDARGIIVTAPGDDQDFVSRFFAPRSGIDEDAVTGSAHTTLIPYWSQKIGKKKMTARQLSKRGGMIYCEDCGDRVKIGGDAQIYLRGEILI
jgi:PhzF family phenazine biosynthesis protein